MDCQALLLSNNPTYQDYPPDKALLVYIEGSALDTLVAARDYAHKGWRLANHPLYGNFRPHQQPYRSLVMLPPQSEAEAALEDSAACSPLHFLEEALLLYQSPVRKVLPQDVPEHMRKDCAMIDRELLRATLESLS